MKQRNHAFDLLCGLCIIRMVMLHITSECALNNCDWWRVTMHWSYYFMSFFFFKAGYFNKTVAGDSRAFIVGKAKSLMMPYFVWGLVGSAIYVFFIAFFMPAKNHYVVDFTYQHFYEESGWYGNGPTWFLFSFFWAYVAMHLISKAPSLKIPLTSKRSFRIKVHWLVLTFPFVSYWLYTIDNPMWFGLDNLFWGIFLFFLGRLWHIILDRLRRRNALILSSILLIAFIGLNIVDSGEYSMAHNLWLLDPQWGESTASWNGFMVLASKTILALCGLSGVLITLKVPEVPVLNYIGKHSMVYFVGHYPILTLYCMLRSYNVRTLRGHWDDWIILALVCFTILTLIVTYIERVPWLSGRWKKEKSETAPRPAHK